MSRDEFRRSISVKIRAVAKTLRLEWDPIGHGQIDDLPADEYESYAPGVVGLIEREADDTEIADHLASIESTQMGLSPQSQEHLLEVVRKLRVAVGATPSSTT